MTRHEELTRQYEDAVFALLLEEVAAAEGARALAELDAAPAVPHTLTNRCRGRMERQTLRRRCKTFGRGFSRVIGKVAVVVLVTMMLFTVVFAASPEFRQRTIDLVTEVFDSYTEVFATEAQLAAGRTPMPTLTVGWIPDGFALNHAESGEMGYAEYYRNSAGVEFMVGVYDLSCGSLYLENGGAATQKITLRDTEGYIATDEDGSIQVLWQINGSDAWVGIGYIINGPAETLLQVVESLTVS